MKSITELALEKYPPKGMNDEDINRLCFILVHKIQLNIAEREMRNKKVMNEKRTEKEDKYGKI